MAMTLLETMIAIAFLYALLSLVASAVQEAAASMINRRGKFLFDAVGEVIATLRAPPAPDQPGDVAKADAEAARPDPQQLAKDLLLSPLISPMMTRTPSSSAGHGGSVVRTIKSVALRKTDAAIDTENVRSHAPSYLPSDLFAAVAASQLDAAGSAARHLALVPTSASVDTPQMQQAIARVFDATMERVSGRYARRTRLWLIAIGFGLASFINADTLRIGRTLYSDPMRAADAADLAEAYMIRHAAALSTNTDPATQRELIDSTLLVLRQQVEQGDTATLPLGWHSANIGWKHCESEDIGCVFGNGVLMVIGWLVTAFAVSFGAPFWFDLLGKLVNVRGTGKKPPSVSDVTARASIDIRAGDGPPVEIVATEPPRD